MKRCNYPCRPPKEEEQADRLLKAEKRWCWPKADLSLKAEEQADRLPKVEKSWCWPKADLSLKAEEQADRLPKVEKKMNRCNYYRLPKAEEAEKKMKRYNYPLPEEMVDVVLGYLTSKEDRDAVSLVCKSWYNVERLNRRKVIVANCYAINPERVMARFPRLTSLTLKRMPDFALRPRVLSPMRSPTWGGSLQPWIETLVSSGVENFEELRLKRMVVTDESLVLLSQSFPHSFKSLVLINCTYTSVSGTGFLAISSNCRSLREMDFQQSIVSDPRGSCFCFLQNSCTTLVSLNFSHLFGHVPVESLERLVAICPNLTSLRLNYTVPPDALPRILVKAPQLVDLGVGSFINDRIPVSETHNRLKDALQKCTSIRSLCGFVSRVEPRLLPAIYPICQSLTSLKFYCSYILRSSFYGLIGHCVKLECLWVSPRALTDGALRVLASTCKELQELRILEDHYDASEICITGEGLVAVSAGCPKLKTLKYMCSEISNEALITVAENCPNLVNFLLHTVDRVRAMAMQPLDEGLGAIVQSCKGLKRLRLRVCFTDQLFLYIGMYAEQLEVLTVDLIKKRVIGPWSYRVNCAESSLCMPDPGRSLQTYTKFRESGMYPFTYSKSPSNIAYRDGMYPLTYLKSRRNIAYRDGMYPLTFSKSPSNLAYRGDYNGSVADVRQAIHFAGESGKGILYVLNGCKKLKEVDIRNSNFCNATLLADVSKYEMIKYLYIESCQVTLGACKQLAQEMPSLNVEIIRTPVIFGTNAIISRHDHDIVKNMCVYRTVVGSRKDAPDYVQIL